jgi:hypothetical protein
MGKNSRTLVVGRSEGKGDQKEREIGRKGVEGGIIEFKGGVRHLFLA